jgi:hypothetical protein
VKLDLRVQSAQLAPKEFKAFKVFKAKLAQQVHKVLLAQQVLQEPRVLIQQLQAQLVRQVLRAHKELKAQRVQRAPPHLKVPLAQQVQLVQRVLPQQLQAQRVLQVRQDPQVPMVAQLQFSITPQTHHQLQADQVREIFVGVIPHRLTQHALTLITLTIRARTLTSCLRYLKQMILLLFKIEMSTTTFKSSKLPQLQHY